MLERTADRIQIALITGMTVAGLAVAYSLPPGARVAIHFDARGVPDGWGPAGVAVLMLPATALFVWLLMRWLPRIDPRRDNLAASAGAVRAIGIAVTVLLAALQGLVLSHAAGHGYEGGNLLLLLVGGLFVVLGNGMGKLRANRTIGIRTPWTLADDWVWDQTHRFGGKVFVAGGVLMACLGLLPFGSGWEGPALAIVSLGLVAITTWRSWRLWQVRQAAR